MPLTVDTITAPAEWASYLINGDASGLEQDDIDAADAFTARIAPAYVVDVARNADGEAEEPWFTWSYGLFGGTANGGNVVDYVTHEQEA